MTAKERVLSAMLLEQAEKNPQLFKKLGLEYRLCLPIKAQQSKTQIKK